MILELRLVVDQAAFTTSLVTVQALCGARAEQSAAEGLSLGNRDRCLTIDQ